MTITEIIHILKYLLLIHLLTLLVSKFVRRSSMQCVTADFQHDTSHDNKCKHCRSVSHTKL